MRKHFLIGSMLNANTSNDGGYIVAGYTTSSSSSNDEDVYVVKLD